MFTAVNIIAILVLQYSLLLHVLAHGQQIDALAAGLLVMYLCSLAIGYFK
jgi:hypothetical protein